MSTETPAMMPPGQVERFKAAQRRWMNKLLAETPMPLRPVELYAFARKNGELLDEAIDEYEDSIAEDFLILHGDPDAPQVRGILSARS